MFPSSVEEIEGLARDSGAFVIANNVSKDEFGRPDVEWTRVVIRLPDDYTGGLPLLRHIILSDSKSSTYRLALLRVLARIAEGSIGFSRQVNEGMIAIPMGLVAVFWLRQFKPLLQADLPQARHNRGLDGLGFVKSAYKAIDHIPHVKFRVGARFTDTEAQNVHQAINDCAGF
jgi:hypothetical protein